MGGRGTSSMGGKKSAMSSKKSKPMEMEWDTAQLISKNVFSVFSDVKPKYAVGNKGNKEKLDYRKWIVKRYEKGIQKTSEDLKNILPSQKREIMKVLNKAKDTLKKFLLEESFSSKKLEKLRETYLEVIKPINNANLKNKPSYDFSKKD